MTNLTARLVDLAAQMELTYNETVSLPTAVTAIAKRVGWTDIAIVVEMEGNAELRRMAKKACIVGAAALTGETA